MLQIPFKFKTCVANTPNKFETYVQFQKGFEVSQNS